MKPVSLRLLRTSLAAAGLALGLSACSLMPPRPNNPKYNAVLPPPVGQKTPDTGSIFDASHMTPLFADVRARHVGDNLTVILNEQTSAQKTADTTTSRDSSASIATPTVLGHAIPSLNSGLSGKNAFTGKGNTTQSNQLTGQITVSVARVLSNGNLMVQGQKWITINQSREYIRLRGIVRPQDITSANTVQSTQLADARISYGGTGAINAANRPGWLTRLMQSVFWPI